MGSPSLLSFCSASIQHQSETSLQIVSWLWGRFCIHHPVEQNQYLWRICIALES